MQIDGVSVEIVTVKLTAKLLRQLPVLGFYELKPLLKGDGNLVDGCVLGWVHGSVFERGRDYEQWLIVRTGECSYGRYSALQQTAKQYKQLLIP